MKEETKLKNWTNGKWKKEFWKTFAEYIKKRDKGICFSCGRKAEGLGYHAGHFIPKSVGGLTLYFHEDNVRGQCYNCNINLGGNQWEYGQRLGEEKVAELMELKKAYRKITNQEYLDLIEEYKIKLENE
jgi:hypothetical protein